MQKKLPMMITWSRMAAAPFMFLALYWENRWAGWITAIIFILGSITDYYDGYFARKFKVESNEGRLMDPIADKILVLAALVVLLAMKRVDAVMVTILLSRDILIGGIRSVAAAEQIIIAAQPAGKWKTAIQMSAIPCLFVNEPLLGLPLAIIGYYGLWLSVILSLISASKYIAGYYQQTKKK
jgi:CDP-diacylglycerol--glycerol-3-phosphate 3-phosphatidyltransferase